MNSYVLSVAQSYISIMTRGRPNILITCLLAKKTNSFSELLLNLEIAHFAKTCPDTEDGSTRETDKTDRQTDRDKERDREYERDTDRQTETETKRENERVCVRARACTGKQRDR